MAEYLSPSIGQVVPQLDQACADLTQNTLVYKLTDYTKQLCESDPELADILLEGQKNLPRCIRYVTEQAQKIAVKKAEAMTAKAVNELPKSKVHGRAIPVMGLAISSDDVYGWARDYYYGGSKVEPTDAMGTAPQRRTPAKNDKSRDKKTGGATSDKKAGSDNDGKDSGKAKSAPEGSGQMSLFGSAA